MKAFIDFFKKEKKIRGPFICEVEKQMFCFLRKSDSRGNKRLMCSLGFFFLDSINNVLEKNSQ